MILLIFDLEWSLYQSYKNPPEVQGRGPEQGISLGRGRVHGEGAWGALGSCLPEALWGRDGGLRGLGAEVGLGAG